MWILYLAVALTLSVSFSACEESGEVEPFERRMQSASRFRRRSRKRNRIRPWPGKKRFHTGTSDIEYDFSELPDWLNEYYPEYTGNDTNRFGIDPRYSLGSVIENIEPNVTLDQRGIWDAGIADPRSDIEIITGFPNNLFMGSYSQRDGDVLLLSLVEEDLAFPFLKPLPMREWSVTDGGNGPPDGATEQNIESWTEIGSDEDIQLDQVSSLNLTGRRIRDLGILVFSHLEVDLVGYPVRLMAWNYSVPGPLIEAVAGDILRVEVHNRMPPSKEPTWDVSKCWPSAGINLDKLPQGATPFGYMNNPHGARIVNIHTHGLQTSPYDDDPYRLIKPGESFTYFFEVPFDHPSGHFWYHPHVHGSVGTHSSNGALGSLIVRGEIDVAMRNAGATEILLPVSFLQFTNVAEDGRYENDPPPFTCPQDGGYRFFGFNLMFAMVAGHAVGTSTNDGSTFTHTNLEKVTVVQPGGLLFVRVLNGGPDRDISVAWEDSNGRLNLPNLRAWVVAYDGISLSEPWSFTFGSPFSPGVEHGSGWIIPVSGRTDFLFRAPSVPGTYYIVSKPTISNGITNPSNGGFKLLRVLVRGTPHPDVGKGWPEKLRLPGPTVRNSLIPNEDIVKQRTFVFEMTNKGHAKPNPLILTGPFGFYFNDKAYEMEEFDSVLVGTSEQWAISNPTTMAHVYHIHTVSFWVVALLDLATNRNVLAQGYWADSVHLPANHLAIIRMKFNYFHGPTVHHCHLLQHEDQGMMSNIDMRRDARTPSRPTEGYIQLMIEHHRHMLSRDRVPSPDVDISLDEYAEAINHEHLPILPVGSIPRISLDSYKPPKCRDLAAMGLLAGVGADGMVSALSRIAQGEKVFYHGDLGHHNFDTLGSVLGQEITLEASPSPLILIHGASCVDDDDDDDVTQHI